MIEIEIIKSKKDDLEKLNRTMTEAFKDDIVLYGEAPYGNDSIGEILNKIDEDQCFSFIIDNEIVGGMYLKKLDEEEYRLKRIWIDKKDQNKGIGTIIITKIEKMIQGTRKITLDTPYKSYRNQYFYEKNGFRKVSEIKVKINESSNLDINFTLFEYVKELR